MGSQARALFDTVRVNAKPALGADPELLLRLSVWTACGARVIAEGARWRDATTLSGMGIEHATAPKADA
jgi:hypothetical protein